MNILAGSILAVALAYILVIGGFAGLAIYVAACVCIGAGRGVRFLYRAATAGRPHHPWSSR